MIFDNIFRKEERFYIIRRKMEQEMELFLKASGWGGDRSKKNNASHAVININYSCGKRLPISWRDAPKAQELYFSISRICKQKTTTFVGS